MDFIGIKYPHQDGVGRHKKITQHWAAREMTSAQDIEYIARQLVN